MNTVKFRRAFTLVELLVAMAVLSLILLLLNSLISQTSLVQKRATARAETFRSARVGFDLIKSTLQQAVLNAHIDFDNPSAPTKFIRKSDLQLIIGRTSDLVPNLSAGQIGPTGGIFFQAPLGFAGTTGTTGADALNAVGYFLSFGSDAAQRPSFIQNFKPRYRYRLMEFKQPSGAFSVYAANGSKSWFQDALAQTNSVDVRPVAENVIALVFMPRASKADTVLPVTYDYDSRSKDHRLPALIDLTMVAISEQSAQALATKHGTSQPLTFDNGWFTNPQNFNDDLEQLSSYLSSHIPKIDFRVFSTTVQLREAK